MISKSYWEGWISCEIRWHTDSMKMFLISWNKNSEITIRWERGILCFWRKTETSKRIWQIMDKSKAVFAKSIGCVFVVFIFLHGCPYLKWALSMLIFCIPSPYSWNICYMSKKGKSTPSVVGHDLLCLYVNSFIDICLIPAPWFLSMYMSLYLLKEKESDLACKIVMFKWPVFLFPFLLLLTCLSHIVSVM